AQQSPLFDRLQLDVGVTFLGNHAPRFVDLNGDGRPDLLDIAHDDQSIDAALGEGGLDFAPAIATPVGPNPFDLELADMEGDGHPDAVVLAGTPLVAKVLVGDGTGHFTAAFSVAVPTFAQDIALADVTRDGRPDLLVLGMEGSQYV